MNIRIRPAVSRDYAILCDLMAEIDEYHIQALPHLFQRPGGPARERSYIEGLISDLEAVILIAEIDGQPSGYAVVLMRESAPIPLLVPRRFALIENIGVTAASRHSGAGRALMSAAENWARARGAEAMELNVYRFNQGAEAFYRQLGYEPLSQRMYKPI